MTIDRWAWDEYWREQLPSRNACLAKASPQLHDALARHWCLVGGRFDSAATIVDLACGNGIVGRRIVSERPDICVFGVDFADIHSDARSDIGPGNVAVTGRVAIEQLPFDDGSIDGAVSQFGFEYCEVPLGVAEVARVLRPGAPLCLVVHHTHSPIALDNIRSDRALRQLLSPVMKRAFLAGDDGLVRAIVAAVPIPVRFEPTIQLLTSALVERLAWSRARRSQTWNAIADAMRPEIALAAALQRSAVDPVHLHHWLSPFDRHFGRISANPLLIDGQPMAWMIEGRRLR